MPLPPVPPTATATATGDGAGSGRRSYGHGIGSLHGQDQLGDGLRLRLEIGQFGLELVLAGGDGVEGLLLGRLFGRNGVERHLLLGAQTVELCALVLQLLLEAERLVALYLQLRGHGLEVVDSRRIAVDGVATVARDPLEVLRPGDELAHVVGTIGERRHVGAAAALVEVDDSTSERGAGVSELAFGFLEFGFECEVLRRHAVVLLLRSGDRGANFVDARLSLGDTTLSGLTFRLDGLELVERRQLSATGLPDLFPELPDPRSFWVGSRAVCAGRADAATTGVAMRIAATRATERRRMCAIVRNISHTGNKPYQCSHRPVGPESVAGRTDFRPEGPLGRGPGESQTFRYLRSPRSEPTMPMTAPMTRHRIPMRIASLEVA
ncbi:MAG: hypothetical protein M5U31_08890 [Acidimicrobiia bacterium]|nr:hypothetical protein [Acidimicrobiia bacterium]